MVQAPKRRDGSTRHQVPAEGNFEEHPYFRVGDRNAGTGVMHYTNELRTREGHILKQSWTVRAATGRGLPGRFDQDVYVALLQIIDQRGLPDDGWLSFSIYELVELMGRGHSGRDYRQVRDSLLRLSSTTIESDNSFYHGGKKTYITDSFNLLSAVKLSEYEDPDGERSDRNAVLLSDYFLESYQANYLKNIDSRFYWSLSSPVAKRLYRLIDKKRTGRHTWQAELFSLRKRIPLSEYKYASKIKEKLAPAHAELIEKEFLEEVGYRKSQGDEYVVYKISDRYQERLSASESDSLSKEEFFCVKRLKAEGMSADVAERLVVSHGHARVMQYIEALPYQRNIRNRAGWLRKAIEHGYELDLPPVSSSTSPTHEPNTPGHEIQITANLHNTTGKHVAGPDQLSLATGLGSDSDFTGGHATSDETDFVLEPVSCLPTDGKSSVEPEVEREPETSLSEMVEERFRNGDFDDVVSSLESVPRSEYSRFVDASSPLVDDSGHRFYLSTDDELYLYVGEPRPENRVHLCSIERE